MGQKTCKEEKKGPSSRENMLSTIQLFNSIFFSPAIVTLPRHISPFANERAQGATARTSCLHGHEVGQIEEMLGPRPLGDVWWEVENEGAEGRKRPKKKFLLLFITAIIPFILFFIIILKNVHNFTRTVLGIFSFSHSNFGVSISVSGESEDVSLFLLYLPFSQGRTCLCKPSPLYIFFFFLSIRAHTRIHEYSSTVCFVVIMHPLWKSLYTQTHGLYQETWCHRHCWAQRASHWWCGWPLADEDEEIGVRL